MKANKLIIAATSLLLLASCGGNSSSSHATGLTSGTPSSTTSSASSTKTMGFLNDGEFYIYVDRLVSELVGGVRPKIKINGTDVQGGFKNAFNGTLTLEAEGTFSKDLYVSVAKSTGEGHLAAAVYGAIEKGNVNAALANIASAATAGGIPNKFFISFSTVRADWQQGHDTKMDEEIQQVWDMTNNQ